MHTQNKFDAANANKLCSIQTHVWNARSAVKRVACLQNCAIASNLVVAKRRRPKVCKGTRPEKAEHMCCLELSKTANSPRRRGRLNSETATSLGCWFSKQSQPNVDDGSVLTKLFIESDFSTSARGVFASLLVKAVSSGAFGKSAQQVCINYTSLEAFSAKNKSSNMKRCNKAAAWVAKKLLRCATEDAAESVFDGTHRVADLCALVLKQLKDSSSNGSSWAVLAAQHKPLLHRAAREPTASRRREVERFFAEHQHARFTIDRLDATSHLAFADREMHFVREIQVASFDVDDDMVHLIALLHQATLFRVQKRYRFKARQRSAPRGFDLTDKPQGKTLLVKRNVWTDEKGVGFSSDFKNLGRFTQHKHTSNDGQGKDGVAHCSSALNVTKVLTYQPLQKNQDTNNKFLNKAHSPKASELSFKKSKHRRTNAASSLKEDICDDMAAYNETCRDLKQQAARNRADRLCRYRRYVVQKIQRGLSNNTPLKIDQILALLPEIEARARKTILAAPGEQVKGKDHKNRNAGSNVDAKEVYAFAKSKVQELLRDVAK